MKPFSAMCYIKENPKRSLIIIFLLFLTTMMFAAGNYVNSYHYYWAKNNDYYDRLCVVTALSSDEDFKEFAEIYQDLLKDEKLIVMERSPRGLVGLPWDCTLGYEMGTASMVFDSPEDLRTAFEIFGISGDFSEVKEGTVCISTALAAQHGLKKGDTLDASVSEGIRGSYRIAALTEDDSFMVFYVTPSEYEKPLRLNIMSRSLSGYDLYEEIRQVCAGRKADITAPLRTSIDRQFEPYVLIFGAGLVILTLILAMIVNSVITGLFLSRRYEFGVYRAIGISKRRVYGKIARELILMDVLAVLGGMLIIFLFTFLINELVYIPAGKFLPYYSSMGLYGFLISNLMVMIPTILLKGHGMCKCDVTEF